MPKCEGRNPVWVPTPLHHSPCWLSSLPLCHRPFREPEPGLVAIPHVTFSASKPPYVDRMWPSRHNAWQHKRTSHFFQVRPVNEQPRILASPASASAAGEPPLRSGCRRSASPPRSGGDEDQVASRESRVTSCFSVRDVAITQSAASAPRGAQQTWPQLL